MGNRKNRLTALQPTLQQSTARRRPAAGRRDQGSRPGWPTLQGTLTGQRGTAVVSRGLPYTVHRTDAPASPRWHRATSPLRGPVWRGAGAGEIEAKDGLPSADRNNKATLLLTGPFRTAKSSAKDLTPLELKLQYAKYHGRASCAVEESPAKTLSRGLFLSIYTCGWYHRVLAWILT